MLYQRRGFVLSDDCLAGSLAGAGDSSFLFFAFFAFRPGSLSRASHACYEWWGHGKWRNRPGLFDAHQFIFGRRRVALAPGMGSGRLSCPIFCRYSPGVVKKRVPAINNANLPRN